MERVTPFLPSRLFGVSDVGAWYDVSDLSSMFQDSAGTTPAALNQPVGLIKDKSGKGNNATASGTQRPTLKQDSAGHYYLLFDGSNNQMSAAFTIAQPWDRISALRQVSWASGNQIYGGVAASAGFMEQTGTTPNIGINDGAFLTLANLALGADGLATERHNGTSSRFAINDSAYQTGNTGTNVPGGVLIGARYGGITPANIRWYGCVMIGRTLADPEIAQYQNYLTNRLSNVLYINSASGSNSNDGFSSGAALQTIASVAKLMRTNMSVQLASGSSWLETLKPSNAINISSYGAGALPILDGATVITNSSFTLYSGNIYQVTLTADPNGTYVSSDTYMMWENGNWLTRVGSSGAMTPGTFYVPNADASVYPTATAYVYPFNSTNPISDGNLYEYSSRPSQIELAALTGASVSGVEVRRGMGGYGPLPMGYSGNVNRCLISKGGKHNIVAKSGSMTDVIAFDCEIARNIIGDGGFVPITHYPAAAGLSYTMTRCMVIAPSGREFSNSCVYSHGATTSTFYDSGTITGFVGYGTGPITPGYSTVAILDGFAMLNAQAPAVSVDYPATYTVKHGIINIQRAGGNGSHIKYAGTPQTTSSGEFSHNALAVQPTASNSLNFGLSIDSATVANIHHNTIYDASPDLIRGADLSFASAASKFKYNIIIIPSGSHEFVRLPSGISCDYNVYVDLGTQGSFYSTALASSYGTLAGWQAATGYDAHSVRLDATGAAALFLNGVAGILNGDFRLNPNYSGAFADGTPIVSNAGVQEYYNFNTRQIVSGQPSAFPNVPTTEAQCRTYILNPTVWTF